MKVKTVCNSMLMLTHMCCHIPHNDENGSNIAKMAPCVFVETSKLNPPGKSMN